jgi:putative intracellular protease/amidase
MVQHRVLIIVANPSVSTTLGWPVGFWASELIHPYDAFVKAGCEVTIASPLGGKVEFDSYSDPRDASGYSKEDTLSLTYISRPEFMRRLENTPAISTVDHRQFDAIVIAGGQSPMFTFRHNRPLADLFVRFYEAGRPSAALCHGTCVLLDAMLSNGDVLIRAKRMTGFANSEEDYADKVVGRTVMPFRIEDEARKLGAHFIAKHAFTPHAIRDENLITGQQQHSGHEVAQLVLDALNEHSQRGTS